MSLTTQFITMLTMIGMGIYLGAAVDTYGRFLQRQKRAHWVVFMNDILFWVIQGLTVFYALLSINEGELRFYIFLALLCGYAAYQSLFRAIYRKILEFIIQTCVTMYRFCVRTCYYVIVRPLQFMFQFFLALLMTGGRILLLMASMLYKLIKMMLRIIFIPIKWLFCLLWRFVPANWRINIEKFFRKFAGVIAKGKNVKSIVQKWWEKRRK
ncbi:spore cortex biosynthesis protein YabQ [Anoxybacillus vitaminiphilus]|uniref:Spore cortex biosynthesis protein YabQ n=1 Tax=Paranoxybacillus vitaminiphilus TaxID=581036 RepID=A0A327Y672_9BACL|nr:spore cortex biosynthesis protein YabQ [Anoxybacillus vitaminiphilus]RAK16553.1 spore cortex biosynthesis protein YabQ [Anoxybacillus vitaminiphilus]